MRGHKTQKSFNKIHMLVLVQVSTTYCRQIKFHADGIRLNRNCMLIHMPHYIYKIDDRTSLVCIEVVRTGVFLTIRVVYKDPQNRWPDL